MARLWTDLSPVPPVPGDGDETEEGPADDRATRGAQWFSWFRRWEFQVHRIFHVNTGFIIQRSTRSRRSEVPWSVEQRFSRTRAMKPRSRLLVRRLRWRVGRWLNGMSSEWLLPFATTFFAGLGVVSESRCGFLHVQPVTPLISIPSRLPGPPLVFNPAFQALLAYPFGPFAR